MRMLIATLLTLACLVTPTTQAASSAGPSVQAAGTWQGMMDVGSRRLRIVLQLHKGSSGAWNATMYSIDASSTPIPVPWVRFNGSSLRLSVNSLAEYAGTISTDGNHIQGKWSQGRGAFPLNLERATAKTMWPLDTSPHKIQFVTVEQGVRLEVLDWGGRGRPVILLAGLGNTAHAFDQFAPKLARWYHVYGITRRGFGASSVPATGYTADRLGDDVLAVVEALHLSRPVIVGHSIAGEELSDLGIRHPEKIAALIYLDAAYSYAFYDDAPPDLLKEGDDVRKKVVKTLPTQRHAAGVIFNGAPAPMPVAAIAAGERRFPAIHSVPILAIFADPHAVYLGPQAPKDPAALAALRAQYVEQTEAQVTAFERAMPSARVVRLEHASHAVYISNEADVLREINTFVSKLAHADSLQ